MKVRLRWPSPALVISLVALFVALGGTSYAAFAVPRNSVGTKQLKNNAVTGKKIKNSAVTAGKIKNSAVTARKIKNSAVTARKIDTKGLVVPDALHATTADSATKATTADSATNATQLGGHAVSDFVATCGRGSAAVVASWYAPQIPSDPTYVAPNRYGGEGGFACNGATPEITKESTGWYRVKVDPVLPTSHVYLLFANPDARSTTPLYVQANSAIGGPVWDVHVYDKNGNPTDPYYLDVMITAQS